MQEHSPVGRYELETHHLAMHGSSFHSFCFDHLLRAPTHKRDVATRSVDLLRAIARSVRERGKEKGREGGRERGREGEVWSVFECTILISWVRGVREGGDRGLGQSTRHHG